MSANFNDIMNVINGTKVEISIVLEYNEVQKQYIWSGNISNYGDNQIGGIYIEQNGNFSFNAQDSKKFSLHEIYKNTADNSDNPELCYVYMNFVFFFKIETKLLRIYKE